jgi:Carboxypeptidase regulatory-like domain/CARDB
LRLSLVVPTAVVFGAVLAGCGGTSKGTLQGRVVKAGGAPVSATRLDLVPLETGGESSHRTTNARGRFTFPDVKKGQYRVSVAYSVSGVFECTLRFPVEILAGKTVARRLDIPVVDVAPDGTAKLPHGKKTRCRTLADPLVSFLCEHAGPFALFTLPPRDLSESGYRRLGRIPSSACRGMRVVGRIRVSADLDDPFSWLFVAAGGKRGWANPVPRQALPREVRAWQDVAVAKARAVPLRVPTLTGNALPDLVFTTPRPSHHVGESCDPSQFAFNEWLMSVKNAGGGLAPKRYELYLSNSPSETELRPMGDASWTRGLAPGEVEEIGTPFTEGKHLALSAFTQVKLDPDNNIKESNEANNELGLGYLPTLTCVKQ